MTFFLAGCGDWNVSSIPLDTPPTKPGGTVLRPELQISFTSIDPSTVSSSVTPAIKGTVTGDATSVTLFSDAACAVPVGAGSVANFADPGIVALVLPNLSTLIHGRAVDSDGNYGPCTLLATYTSDTLGPNLHSFRIDESEYTNKTALSYTVLGELADATEYCVLENDNLISSCQWQNLPLPVTLASTPPHGFKTYTLFLKDSAGNISNRLYSNTVHVDVVNPDAPVSPATVPPTPSSVMAPLVKGSVSSEATAVAVYSDNLCSQVLGQGSRDTFVTTGIQITVPLGATVSLYGESRDRAGNKSACVYLMDYVHQSGAVTPLTVGFFAMSPGSPSSNASPRVVGYSSSDIALINFFADSSCAGTVIGTGNRTTFETTGITVSVNHNANSAIYAKGFDGSMNPTACNLMSTYLHDDIAPSNVSGLTHKTSHNSSSSSPAISWVSSFADAGAGILKVEYSLGSAAGATDVRGWTPVNVTSPAVFTGLTLVHGNTYYVNFKSTDKALNTSAVLSSAGWTVDTVGPAAAPVLSSFNPVSPSATNNNPRVIGTSTADTETVRLYSDAGCASLLSSGTKAEFAGTGVQLNLLANSETSVYGKAFDAAENGSACAYLGNYRHDNLAPTLSGVSLVVGAFVNSLTVPLSVGAMTGEPTQYCLLVNSTNAASCSWQNLPFPTHATLSGGDGAKVVSAFVRDGAGNLSSRVDSNTVTLDTVSPTWASPGVSYLSTHPSSTSSPAVSYSQTASDTGSPFVYQYALGTGTVGGAINNVVDWTGVTSASFTIGGLALSDGVTYYVRMRALDSAGNFVLSPINAGFLVSVNVPAPTFFATFPQSPSGASSAPLVKGYMDVVADIVTLYSNAACTTVIGTGSRATFESTGVSVAVNANSVTTIYARARDTAISKDSVCAFMTSYIHDTQGPIASVSVDDGQFSTTTAASPLISWVGGGTDGGSGFNRFEYAIGTSPMFEDVVAWTSAGSSVSVTVTGLSLVANTRYYAKVRSVDNVGNISAVTVGDGWIIDTLGPSLNFTMPFENDTIITEKRTMVGVCEAGLDIQLTYGMGILGPVSVPCSSAGEFSVDVVMEGVEGARSVTVSQTDLAGNNSGAIVRNVLYKPTFSMLGDGLNAQVWAMAHANDGSRDILVGGTFTQLGDITINRLARLKYNGDRIESFSIGTGFNNTVQAILPTRDGSGQMYVAGLFTDFDGNTTADYLVRLNADGSWDNTFAPVIVGVVYALEYGPGDTIFVGGAFTTVNGSATTPRLVQLAANGTTVTSFDVATGGALTTEVRALRLSADENSLFVGGLFTTYRGTTVNRIMKVNVSNGALAAGWTGVGVNNYVYDIELAPEDTNEIYIGGSFTQYGATASNALRIARLAPNGTLSATFNAAAGATNAFSGVVRDIVVARDGTNDIYVGGEFTAFKGTTQNYFARVQSNGTLSAGFGNRGFGSYVYALLMPPSASNPYDDVYVGGNFTTYDSFGFARLVRLNKDGTPDVGINIGAGIAGGSGLVYEIAELNDGSDRLFVAGSFGTYRGAASANLVRINQDGSVDTSFNVGTGFNSYVRTLYYDKANQKLYVGGAFTTYKGVAATRMVRLNMDGSLDSTFNIGTGFNDVVREIIPAPGHAGKVYVGGSFTTYKGVNSNRAIRLNADGSIDNSFNIGSGFSSYIQVAKPVGDGTNDIYMAGQFSTYNGTARNYIVRLRDSGQINSAFNVGSGPSYASPATGADVQDLAVAPDGGLYVAGIYQRFQAQVRMGLVKLKPSGALDNTFNVGSGLMYRYTASSTTVDRGYVTSITLAKDGRVYATGAFYGYFSPYGTSSYPITVPRIICLNTDGSMDMSFGLGAGVNTTGYGVKMADDGSGDIFLLGDFSTYNTLNRNGLVRIKENGNPN